MCSSDVDIGGLGCSNETRMQRPVRIRFRKSISIFNFSRGRSNIIIPSSIYTTYLFFLSTRCFPYNLYKRTIIVCYHEQPLGSTGVHLSLFGPYVRIYGDIMVFF